MFSALLDRHEESARRADLRAGIVAATIANCHRGKSDKPFRPLDFMPSVSRDERSKADQSSKAAEIISSLAPFGLKRDESR